MPGAGLTCQEGLDHLGIFLGQHRAGGIDQNAANGQGAPYLIEQLALQRGQRGDVVRLAGQLDIGMPTDHARGRTGRIQQNAVKGLSIPPGVQVAAIGRLERGLQAQALQVIPYPFQPGRFQIQRYHFLQRGLQFENMAGLAAGRAAGVQYPLAGLQLQQRRRQLGRFVLHADRTGGEPRQLLHITGLGQGHAIGAEGTGDSGDTGVLQLLQVSIAAGLPAIDPQAHRRVQVVGCTQRFPVLRPDLLQGLLQPARMGDADHRVMFQLRQQGGALALGAAQHGIEHALGPGLLQGDGQLHGLGNGRMGRHPGIQQLVHANQQQGMQVAVGRFQRLLQQMGGQAIEALEPARGAQRQFPGQGLVPRHYLLELGGQAAAQ